MIRYWWDRLLLTIGWGHVCIYDDPSNPRYIGFTAGICDKRGFHRGRRPQWWSGR